MSEASSRLVILLIAILAILQVLDVVSTTLVLNAGGMEGNPLMVPLVDQPTRLLAFKLGIVGTIGFLALKTGRALLAPLLTINTFYAAIVAWNLSLLN
jgi:hypothetical protein